MRYAAQTTVSADRSRAEIEQTLQRYGATGFAYGWERERAMIAFDMKNRRIKFLLPLPGTDAREFTHNARGSRRPPEAARKAWEQGTRQRWRALSLAIKAKLESVAARIETFEEAFLPHIVLPNGETVGDWLSPQIASVYASGQMPPLLPGPGQTEAS